MKVLVSYSHHSRYVGPQILDDPTARAIGCRCPFFPDSRPWIPKQGQMQACGQAERMVRDSKKCIRRIADSCNRRTLHSNEKRSFLKAVQCLGRKPSCSRKTFPGAISRYDEFVAVHVDQTDYVHFVGHFIICGYFFLACIAAALIMLPRASLLPARVRRGPPNRLRLQGRHSILGLTHRHRVRKGNERLAHI